MAQPIRISILANASSALRVVSRTVAAVARASRTISRNRPVIEPTLNDRGLMRSADGRLRDLRGRFAREGAIIGAAGGAALVLGFRLRASPLGRLGRTILAPLGKSFSVLGRSMGVSLMGFIAAGAAANAAQVAPAVVGAIGSLAPALGVIPGAAAAAVSAMAALKIATSGVGKAIGEGLTGDIEAFERALKKLPPAAQDFARSVVKLRPQIQALRQSVAKSFFAGLGDEVKLLGATYLPMLSQHLSDVAGGFNRAAREASGFLRQSKTVRSMREMFGNLGKTVDGVSAALPNVLKGMLPLFTVSASLLPGMTNGLKNITAEFAAGMQRAADSGALRSMIQSGVQAFMSLMSVLHSVGSIIKSVFFDAASAGSGFIGTLSTILARVADFLDSAEGMSAVRSVWDSIGAVASALGGALAVVLPALGQALQTIAPIIPPLAQAMGGFLAALAPILPVAGELLATIGAALRPAFESLGPVLAQVATAAGGLIKAILPVLPTIAQIAAVIGGVLANVLTKLAPIIGPLVQMIGTALLNAVQALAPVFIDLANTMAPIIGPILGKLVEVLAAVLRAVVPLVPIMANLFLTVIKAAAPILPPLLDAFSQLVTLLGGVLAETLTALAPVFTALAEHMSAMMPVFTPLITAVLDVVKALLPLLPLIAQLIGVLLPPLIALISPLIALVAKLATVFLTLVATGLTVIVNFIRDKVLPIIMRWVGAFRDFGDNAKRVFEAVKLVVSTVFSYIADFVRGRIDAVMGAIGFLFGIKDRLMNIGRDIMRGLADGIQAGLNWVREKISGLGDLIPGWLKSTLGIRSPSRVMAGIGRDTIAGLAAGLKAEIPRVERTIGAVSEAITGLSTSPVVDLSFSAASFGATTGGSTESAKVVQINVNVAPTSDPAETGRQVVRAVRAYEATFGRTVLVS